MYLYDQWTLFSGLNWTSWRNCLAKTISWRDMLFKHLKALGCVRSSKPGTPNGSAQCALPFPKGWHLFSIEKEGKLALHVHSACMFSNVRKLSPVSRFLFGRRSLSSTWMNFAILHHQYRPAGKVTMFCFSPTKVQKTLSHSVPKVRLHLCFMMCSFHSVQIRCWNGSFAVSITLDVRPANWTCSSTSL